MPGEMGLCGRIHSAECDKYDVISNLLNTTNAKENWTVVPLGGVRLCVKVLRKFLYT